MKHFGFVISFLAAAMFTGCGRVPEGEAPAENATTSAPKPARASYSLQWVSNDIPQTMQAGKAVPIKVSVKNTGDWPWPDAATANPSRPDGTYAVRMSYFWADANGKALAPVNERGELTASVPPGQTANFTMTIAAPKQTGNYQLQIDLVEELVVFFSTKGTEKLVVPVTVQ